MSVTPPLRIEAAFRKREPSFSAFQLVSMNGRLYTLSVTSLNGDTTIHHALDKAHWEKLAETVQGIFHSTRAMATHDPANVDLMQEEINTVSISLLDPKMPISYQKAKNAAEEHLSANQMNFLKKDHPIADFKHDFIKELHQTFRNPESKTHRHLDRLSLEKRQVREDNLSSLTAQMQSLDPSLRQLAAPLYSSLDHKKENPHAHVLDKEHFQILTSLFASEHTYTSPLVSLDDILQKEETLKEYCKALALKDEEFLYVPLQVSLEEKKPHATQKQTLGLFIDKKNKKLYLYDPLAQDLKKYPHVRTLLDTLTDEIFTGSAPGEVKLITNAKKVPHQSYYPRSLKEKSLHNPTETFSPTPNEQYNNLRYHLAFLEKMVRSLDKEQAFKSFTRSIFHREHLEEFAQEFSKKVQTTLAIPYEKALITGL